jgi:hypothetical protein
MNPKMNIYLLAALLICSATEVSSAEAKEQTAGALPDSAKIPANQSPSAVQEDLGFIVIDGRTNKVVSVISDNPIEVYVRYESADRGQGARKIPRQELPPQLRVKYPYDATKAAEYRKQQADQATEQAALAAQQATKARAAAREALRQREREILAQIDSFNKQDFELQKEKNILNSLPAGGGRRLKAKQISGQQEIIRQYIDQLNLQLAQIRAQITGTN